MPSRTKKATFNLQPELLAALDAAIANGAAQSKNALVERALRRELGELQRQERRRLWQEARRDPLFMHDLDALTQAFAAVDSDLPDEDA